MVDATALDTVCVKFRKKADLDYVIRHLEPDTLVITKDMNFDFEFIEEGRQLSLINDQVVQSFQSFERELAKVEVNEDGRYKPYVKLAFINMSAMSKSCKELALKIKDTDKDKKKKEKAERGEPDSEEEEVVIEEVYENFTKEDLAYASFSNRKWDAPAQATEDDVRKGDTGISAGGAPPSLGASETVIKKPTVEETRKIKGYSTGEIDERKGEQKVYIEDPEVVNSDASDIHLTYTQWNWSIRVDTPGQPALVLGPIDNGHINPHKCKWRLSQGKRLTITLARANQNDMYKKPRIPKIPDPDGNKDDGSGGTLAVLAPFFIVLVAMAAYFMVNGTSGSK